MTTSIYQAPDIRKQRLEQVEEFINDKRVRRLIMAQSYQQTVKDKATKLHGKSVEKFEKQSHLFNLSMERLVEQIEKMQERLDRMNALHSELTNIEGVINDQV